MTTIRTATLSNAIAIGSAARIVAIDHATVAQRNEVVAEMADVANGMIAPNTIVTRPHAAAIDRQSIAIGRVNDRATENDSL